MRKLLSVLVLSFLFGGIGYANTAIGYFQCEEYGSNTGLKPLSNVKLKIDLTLGIMNIFLNDYGIYEVSDRNIKARRKGIGSDNILRTINFDRYTGNLAFMAWGNNAGVIKLRCEKVSDKKIF